jgi:hypothetical protein
VIFEDSVCCSQRTLLCGTPTVAQGDVIPLLTMRFYQFDGVHITGIDIQNTAGELGIGFEGVNAVDDISRNGF